MIDYILYSEFDLKLGNVVRVQEPSPCGVDPDTLASLMIPDGSHNNYKDFLFFSHKKDPNFMDSIASSIRNLSSKLVENSTNYKDLSDVKEFQANQICFAEG